MKERIDEKNWIQNETGFLDEQVVKEELCFDSYKSVENILSKYDRGLAELFSNVGRRIAEYNCYVAEDDEGGLLQGPYENGVFDNFRLNGEKINLIPSEIKGDCHEDCILLSDCSWSGRGATFQKYAKELVKCWLKCIHINKRTLVLTTSWDEKSFKKTYKGEFDIYSKHHRLAVVLITSAGASIVYLEK